MHKYLLAFLFFFSAQVLNAQFLFDYERSSYFVPRTKSGSIVGFTVISTIEGGEKGFVFFYKPEGTLSSFNPSEMRCEGCEVMFLTFGENLTSKIYLSNGREMEVKGPIRLKFSMFNIYFDPRTPQRFTSISYIDESDAFIAAFSNIESVLNQKEDPARKLSNVLLPNAPEEFRYKNRTLNIGEGEFTGQSIGVRVDRRNPCLLSDALVLGEEDAKALIEGRSLSENARKSLGALRKGDYVNTIESDFIVLTVTEEKVIVFEPKNGNTISSISPLGAAGYESVCVISKL